MPVGPIGLADHVGRDVVVAVAGSLKRDLGWRLRTRPTGCAGRAVTASRPQVWTETSDADGRRGGELKDLAGPDADNADQLILPLLDTFVTLLREGGAADEDVTDAAMIFGSGFTCFRGGPLHYARNRGALDICERLSP